MVPRSDLARWPTALMALLVILLPPTLASCGGGSAPGESKADLEAQLAKLPQHIEDDFRAGDTNKDLRLQDIELEAMIKEDFDAFDVVEDGEINEADVRKNEEKGGLGPRGEKAELDVEASLAFIDLDKDGRVPFEEYAVHVDRHFHQDMDTNKDGHIDPSESLAFYQRLYGGGKAR